MNSRLFIFIFYLYYVFIRNFHCSIYILVLIFVNYKVPWEWTREKLLFWGFTTMNIFPQTSGRHWSKNNQNDHVPVHFLKVWQSSIHCITRMTKYELVLRRIVRHFCCSLNGNSTCFLRAGDCQLRALSTCTETEYFLEFFLQLIRFIKMPCDSRANESVSAFSLFCLFIYLFQSSVAECCYWEVLCWVRLWENWNFKGMDLFRVILPSEQTSAAFHL